MKILIVEDNYASRIYMEKVFGQLGDLDVAENGVKALELIARQMVEGSGYEVVCLDIMMPKVDGIEVLKKIRLLETEHQVLPQDRAVILMTSAICDEETMDQAFQYGCNHYITKPIALEELERIFVEVGLITE